MDSLPVLDVDGPSVDHLLPPVIFSGLVDAFMSNSGAAAIVACPTRSVFLRKALESFGLEGLPDVP
jgi:hypothetical protein